MKKIKFNALEITGKSAISFVSFLIAAMHLCFLFLFLDFKVMPLMYFNIGSVTFYIVLGMILISVKRINHYLLVLTLMYVEVITHAILCTLLLGVDTFFILYPIIVLPVIGYLLFFNLKNKQTFMVAVVVFIIVTVIVTGVSVGVAEFYGGTVPTDVAVLSRKEKMIFRVVNIAFSALALFGFTVIFYVEMTSLMAQLRESTERLKYTATHDALTGLTNRRSFWEYFDALCSGDDHYNIAMGDLDSFKKINDTYGHGCGDMVLKSVADVILGMTKDNEIACRWGGEEMVVVFMGGREEALKRLEEMRHKIEALNLTYSGLDIHVTMTFGFADSEEIGRALSEINLEKKDDPDSVTKRFGVESLISMVDKRLYNGKHSGKNVIVSA